MRLYLDDNLANVALAAQLRKAGHEVVLPRDVGTSGQADAQHLAYAATHGHVSLTGDHEDFLHLHLLVQATGGRHSTPREI
jgi:predicted nuclease of predicted toxin-antitoxin system